MYTLIKPECIIEEKTIASSWRLLEEVEQAALLSLHLIMLDLKVSSPLCHLWHFLWHVLCHFRCLRCILCHLCMSSYVIFHVFYVIFYVFYVIFEQAEHSSQGTWSSSMKRKRWSDDLMRWCVVCGRWGNLGPSGHSLFGLRHSVSIPVRWRRPPVLPTCLTLGPVLPLVSLPLSQIGTTYLVTS